MVTNELPHGRPRDIKIVRVIRIICEICGLKEIV